MQVEKQKWRAAPLAKALSFQHQVVFGLALLLMGFLTPASAWAQTPREPLTVLASIRPLALLVQEVAGDAAQVEVLLESNASPHSYSLRVSDMRRIQSADLLVWLGPQFEGFLAKPAKRRQPLANLILLEAADLEVQSGESEHDHNTRHSDEHGSDLHLWLDPSQAEKLLAAIAERLVQLRPAQSDVFRANLAAARERVRAASEQVAEQLAPVAEREFGVSHDAYSHFAAYFGLRQAGALSAMPDQALSAGHLRDTLRQLENARCLIVEASESPDTIQRLERTFKLPAVTADHLALEPNIRTYPDLLRQMGDQFKKCLTN